MLARLSLYNHRYSGITSFVFVAYLPCLLGPRAMLRSQYQCLTCIKSFVPSIVYSRLSTSLHSLKSATSPAAEDSHDSEAHVEQRQRVRNQSSHLQNMPELEYVHHAIARLTKQ
jgi:hypothetical protein